MLISLSTIPFPLKVDGGDAFGPSRTIVVKSDFTEGTDGRVEELLRKVKVSKKTALNGVYENYLDLSFIHILRQI